MRAEIQTCVTAPAKAPALAMLKLPLVSLAPPLMAARERPKKAPPVMNIIAGVAMAATCQPRYWKTYRPVSMRPIVAYPVKMETSARTPCKKVDKI